MDENKELVSEMFSLQKEMIKQMPWYAKLYAVFSIALSISIPVTFLYLVFKFISSN